MCTRLLRALRARLRFPHYLPCFDFLPFTSTDPYYHLHSSLQSSVGDGRYTGLHGSNGETWRRLGGCLEVHVLPEDKGEVKCQNQPFGGPSHPGRNGQTPPSPRCAGGRATGRGGGLPVAPGKGAFPEEKQENASRRASVRRSFKLPAMKWSRA